MIRGVIMSETYFVTGGAGFVGSNFVRYLLKNTAARVVVVDKFVRTGSWENIAACEKDPRFSFFEVDTADGRALRAILRTAKPTKVVHLAGETSVDRSIDEARIFMKTNVGGAFEVAQQCRQVLSTYDDDKLARFSFVHASTMRAAGPVDANGEALGPTSPGAASALAAESIILSYYRTYKLPYLVVRSTNLMGPWQSPERLLPLVVARALTGTTIPLYGDGSARRDWMFVDDYCSGLLAAAKRGRYGAVYELGRGEPLSSREVVAKVLAAVEAEKPAAKNEAMQLAGYTDYVQLVTAHRLTRSIRPQINAFLKGFCELVPPSLISLFTPEELELLIAGLPDIDVADLKRHTEYVGYRPTDEAIQFFWAAVESFDASDRARLLMFVTGTSKVPLGGFKALRGQRGPQRFTIQKVGGDPESLPASHTCFNQLDLYPYRDADTLRDKLIIAVRECGEGFGFA